MTHRPLSFGWMAVCVIGCVVAVAPLGCRVGPDYASPVVEIPDAHRADDSTQLDEDAPIFADVAWFEVFDDPQLQALIRIALIENYDVRLAAERILEARAVLTIVTAAQLPDVDARAEGEFRQLSENGPVPLGVGQDERQEQGLLNARLSWELDVWGRIARATESAQAELLATSWARDGVIQTLVAELALAWFDLLELDAELAISLNTLESWETSRRLVELRLEQGVSNKVELRQAEGLVLRTAGLIPDLERRIEQQENLIQFLIGTNPGAVLRERTLLQQGRRVDVPAGLPSELLDRRPDVRVAEQQLISANALIGEARARLFPTIELTASGGFASEHLSDLFESDSQAWSITPSATLPIFNRGRLQAGVEVSESQQRQAALFYLRTLQIAFNEVANALVGHTKTSAVRAVREQFELTLADQARLSRERYRGGVTSYLEVLDSERDHFDAQLDLARSLRDELQAIVLLYRALGGGWYYAREAAAVGVQEVAVYEDEPSGSDAAEVDAGP